MCPPRFCPAMRLAREFRRRARVEERGSRRVGRRPQLLRSRSGAPGGRRGRNCRARRCAPPRIRPVARTRLATRGSRRRGARLRPHPNRGGSRRRALPRPSRRAPRRRERGARSKARGRGDAFREPRPRPGPGPSERDSRRARSARSGFSSVHSRQSTCRAPGTWPAEKSLALRASRTTISGRLAAACAESTIVIRPTDAPFPASPETARAETPRRRNSVPTGPFSSKNRAPGLRNGLSSP